MSEIETGMVVKTSVLGTIRIFVVMLAGFLASKVPRSEPLLTKETCRTSSRVCALLFLPSLVLSSIGSTLTPSTLLESWQLIFAAGFTILISFATAGLLGRVFLSPEDRRRLLPVQLAIAFPNSVTFPLLLVDALCQQDAINGDFDGDSDYCFTRGTGMIFIFFMVWQILFYGWGFPTLEQDSKLELKLTGPSESSGTTTAAVHQLTSIERIGVLFDDERIDSSSTQETNASGGVAIDIENNIDGLVSTSAIPESNGTHRDTTINRESCPTSIDHPAASTAAEGARDSFNCSQGQLVPSTIAMTSVADGRGMTTENINVGQTGTSTVVEDGTSVGYCTAIERRARKVVQSPNILAVFFGVVISLMPSLQDMLFNNTQAALWPLGAALQTLGTPVVALSTVVMAGSLLQVPKVAVAANGEQSSSRYRIVAGALLVGCRLIVVPAVGFVLFWVANTQSTIMGSNRLMHVIILIEFAMPSAAVFSPAASVLFLPLSTSTLIVCVPPFHILDGSSLPLFGMLQMIIVTLNQLKMPATAGFMARLYVVHYGISILTVSAWTAVALRMVY